MGLFDVFQAEATSAITTRVPGKLGRVADTVVNAILQNRNNLGTATQIGKKGPVDPMAAARARPDPLMNIDWFCQLPTLQGVSTFPYQLSWDRVEEVTVPPMLQFEPQSNYRAGKMYHYPSHSSLGTMSLKLYEGANGETLGYFRNWQNLILDMETGLYNPPAMFKFPIVIVLYDVAKYEVAVLTYLGCWPQSVDSLNLSSGAAEKLTPTVEMSVDDVLLSFVKLSAEQAQSIAGTTGKEFPPRFSQVPSIFPDGLQSILGL